MNPNPLSMRSRAMVPVGIPVSSECSRPCTGKPCNLLEIRPLGACPVENGASVGASTYEVKTRRPARFLLLPRLRRLRRLPRLQPRRPRQTVHLQGLRRRRRRSGWYAWRPAWNYSVAGFGAAVPAVAAAGATGAAGAAGAAPGCVGYVVQ